MREDIFEGFYAKFDNVRSRRGRGGNYPYVSADDVTDRMNKLFRGNWSSEVKDYYEVGNDIIVKVRVTVLDPDTNMWFSHEGFGGHRQSDGDEAGTSFKAAYSKALVNACRRWGVALYLKDDEDSVPAPVDNIPTINRANPPTGGGVPSLPPTQVNVQPAPANEHIPFPTEVKVPVVPNIPVPGQVNIPVQANVTVQQEQVTSPAAASLPKIPIPPSANSGSNNMTVSTSMSAVDGVSNAAETISDVQKVSIESLIDIYGVPYNDMAQGALGKVPDINTLTHSEAISIIQYGHKLCRERK